jgi:SOS-response transcriptional repressor LexA
MWDHIRPIEGSKKIPIISWQEIMQWDNILHKYGNTEPEDYVLNFSNYNDSCLAFRVESDAMNVPSSNGKSFKKGDIVIFDKTAKPEQGKFVAFIEKGSNTGSFRQYVQEADRIYLKALNPQYSLISLDENVKIIGVMVGHLDLNPIG